MPNVAAGPAVAALSLFRFVLAISNKRVGLRRQLESQDISCVFKSAGGRAVLGIGSCDGAKSCRILLKVNGVHCDALIDVA